MSDSAQPIRLKAPDDPTLQLPERFSRLSPSMLIGGCILLLAGTALGVYAGNSHSGDGWRYAMCAYLIAYLFCLTISLGSLFFVIVQHLCRAGWSATVRRVSELFASVIPIFAILFLPILAAVWTSGTLYDWSNPSYGAEKHISEKVWQAKTSYLNAPFFTFRALIYFGVWVGLTRFFCGTSLRQDETGEVRLTEKMQFWSGPGMILFAFSISFAAFDWIMSLAPMWFSTMFGVYIFTGSVLSALAAMTVLIYLFQVNGALRSEVTVEHYHDLAKLTFGFIVFWAYISFSQYLLIWYGNIPEEAEWFFHRQTHGWGVVSILLILGHWLLPFFGLMSMYVRRRPKWIFFWATYLLVMHYIDLYWAIMPQAASSAHAVSATGGGLGLVTALLSVVGMSSLFVGLVLRQASQVPLIPVRDPRLASSLAFENH